MRTVNAVLLVLGDTLINRYQAYKHQVRAMDFTDLKRETVRLMQQGDAVAYLQIRLDARCRHLLLDEFQGMNPMQWRIPQGWLAGYVGTDTQSSIFPVGDPKQPICRLRRADTRLPDAAHEMLVVGFNAVVLRTNHTCRNVPVVLGWVNAVFLQV